MVFSKSSAVSPGKPMMKSDESDRSGRAALSFLYQRLELEHRVAALHRRQDAVGTRLHRQVQVRDQLGDAAIDVDQALRHFARVGGGVADAFDAGHVGQGLDQKGEVGGIPVVRRALVGIDVLAEQGDLAHAALRQRRNLGDHVGEGTRYLLAARIGHDAETAVFRAAFHDRDEGGGSGHAGRRQRVELFDLGKGDVDLRASAFPSRGDHLRQAVQGLRAEYQVDVRRPRDDRRALLAGDAATDADHQVRVELLQVPHPAEVVEHLLLRLFAHRAGVEQDDVGFLGIVGLDRTVAAGQYVGHLVGVVFVHLATEGADEHFLGHRCLPDEV
jgi:hypothetical protein